jgi:uncharacterized protein YaaN involved in tellurite resistance
MKETAVECLRKEAIELLAQAMEGTLNIDTLKDDVYRIVTQAKEMEKEQIINAYDQGCEAGYELAKNDDFIEGFQVKEAKEYYNETFKSE